MLVPILRLGILVRVQRPRLVTGKDPINVFRDRIVIWAKRCQAPPLFSGSLQIHHRRQLGIPRHQRQML